MPAISWVSLKIIPSILSQLMHISSKLAQLTFERFQLWNLPFTIENTNPAFYAFLG